MVSYLKTPCINITFKDLVKKINEINLFARSTVVKVTIIKSVQHVSPESKDGHAIVGR